MADRVRRAADLRSRQRLAPHEEARVARVRDDAREIAKITHPHEDPDHHAQREAAKEHDAILQERAAMEAGHIRQVPDAKLQQYRDVRARVDQHLEKVHADLDKAHQDALDKLSHLESVRELNRDDFDTAEVDTEELHGAYAAASDELHQARRSGGSAGYRTSVSEPEHEIIEHPGEDATEEELASYEQNRASREATYRAAAEDAQAALEKLAGHQKDALREMANAEKTEKKAARAAVREAELDDHDLVNDKHFDQHDVNDEGEIADPEIRAHLERARAASESAVANAIGEREAMQLPQMDDAREALSEAARATSRAARELARFNKRQPPAEQ